MYGLHAGRVLGRDYHPITLARPRVDLPQARALQLGLAIGVHLVLDRTGPGRKCAPSRSWHSFD